MKATSLTAIIAIAFLIGFGVEVATNSVGNEGLLLKLGALPDSGQLHGQYWRFATYSFLHFNLLHLLANTLLLLWIGRILEQRIGAAFTGIIYLCSVFCSAVAIIIVHNLDPKPGATVGASGGVFGLLAAALVLSHFGDAGFFNQENRLSKWIWIVLLAGVGISFLPGISMAGHVGGIFGGAIPACIVAWRKANLTRA